MSTAFLERTKRISIARSQLTKTDLTFPAADVPELMVVLRDVLYGLDCAKAAADACCIFAVLEGDVDMEGSADEDYLLRLAKHFLFAVADVSAGAVASRARVCALTHRNRYLKKFFDEFKNCCSRGRARASSAALPQVLPAVQRAALRAQRNSSPSTQLQQRPPSALPPTAICLSARSVWCRPPVEALPPVLAQA
jgi:hypothetical protein